MLIILNNPFHLEWPDPRIEMASHVPTMESVDDEVLLTTTHASQEPPKPSFSMNAVEDWQLPLKYRRQPLDDYEIEYINVSTAPFIPFITWLSMRFMRSRYLRVRISST